MKNLVLDISFPMFCVSCQKEGSYLCEDCFYTIDISGKIHSFSPFKNILCATENNFIIRKLINNYYLAKETAKPLAGILLACLIKAEKDLLKDYVLIPVEKEKREIKRIGFDPATELCKDLSLVLKMPIAKNTNNKALLVDLIFNKERLEKKAKELKAKEISALVLTSIIEK